MRLARQPMLNSRYESRSTLKIPRTPRHHGMPAATQIGLRWNTRYEAPKPRLIQRLKALMRYPDEGELDRAEQTITAIRSLPNVGEYGGSVRIEN